MLPFMSSLRNTEMHSRTQIPKSASAFDVADKPTLNLKARKSIFDIAGRSNRLSNANYRWFSSKQNRTGMNLKTAC